METYSIETFFDEQWTSDLFAEIKYVHKEIAPTYLPGRWRARREGTSLEWVGISEVSPGEHVPPKRRVRHLNDRFLGKRVFRHVYAAEEREALYLFLDVSPSVRAHEMKFSRLLQSAAVFAYNAEVYRDEVRAIAIDCASRRMYSKMEVYDYFGFVRSLALSGLSANMPVLPKDQVFKTLVSDTLAVKIHGGVVIVVSDFFDLAEWEPYLAEMARLKTVIPIVVRADPEELLAKNAFHITTVDPETGARQVLSLIGSGKRRLRALLQGALSAREGTLKRITGNQPFVFGSEKDLTDMVHFFKTFFAQRTKQ